MLLNKIIIKLIIPYIIFVVFFILINSDGYLCDCFENYGMAIVVAMAIIFFIGLMPIAYLMEKNKKGWKFYHTIFTIILFVVTFYAIMAVGKYLYVPNGANF